MEKNLERYVDRLKEVRRDMGKSSEGRGWGRGSGENDKKSMGKVVMRVGGKKVRHMTK